MTITLLSPVAGPAAATETSADGAVPRAGPHESALDAVRLALSRDRVPSHEQRRDLSQRLLGEASAPTDGQHRDELLAAVVELNVRVATAVARRYSRRGVAQEDLEQVACEGLIKAVRRYDATRDHDLLSYAVPTIRGEVLRHFRDHSWSVRPPRRVQELQHRMRRTADDLAAAGGREPTEAELRRALGVSAADHQEAATALGCFRPASLDQPTEPGDGASLGDLVLAEVDQLAAAEARSMLAGPLRLLDERQQRVVHLRYFEDRTQQEIGTELGVTQATVSRWLREALDALREAVGPVV